MSKFIDRAVPLFVLAWFTVGWIPSVVTGNPMYFFLWIIAPATFLALLFVVGLWVSAVQAAFGKDE